MKGKARKDNPANRNKAASAEGKIRLLTVPQASEQTQISVRQLHRMIRNGTLPVTRFGRAIRIHPKDLGL